MSVTVTDCFAVKLFSAFTNTIFVTVMSFGMSASSKPVTVAPVTVSILPDGTVTPPVAVSKPVTPSVPPTEPLPLAVTSPITSTFPLTITFPDPDVVIAIF